MCSNVRSTVCTVRIAALPPLLAVLYRAGLIELGWHGIAWIQSILESICICDANATWGEKSPASQPHGLGGVPTSQAVQPSPEDFLAQLITRE